MAGHSNTAQKIHLHMKLKDDINELQKQNSELRTKLHRFEAATARDLEAVAASLPLPATARSPPQAESAGRVLSPSRGAAACDENAPGNSLSPASKAPLGKAEAAAPPAARVPANP